MKVVEKEVENIRHHIDNPNVQKHALILSRLKLSNSFFRLIPKLAQSRKYSIVLEGHRFAAVSQKTISEQKPTLVHSKHLKNTGVSEQIFNCDSNQSSDSISTIGKVVLYHRV